MNATTFASTIKKYSIYLFSIFILLAACDSDDNENITDDDYHSIDDDYFGDNDCDLLAFEDYDTYELGSDFEFSITDAYIEENCMFLSITYSGCEENITVILVDQGVVMESFPVQKNVKFIVTTDVTDCLPFFEANISFNLIPLRVANESQINFNLEGFSEQLLYTY